MRTQSELIVSSPEYAAENFARKKVDANIGHRAFRKKYAKRHLGRQRTQDFNSALEEHSATLRTTFTNLQREGDGEICRVCNTPIYGLLHCDGWLACIHWGCAQALVETEERQHFKKSSCLHVTSQTREQPIRIAHENMQIVKTSPSILMQKLILLSRIALPKTKIP